MHHRHGHFLPANGVHFLAQDVFDLGHGAPGQGQVAEDAGRQLTDESGPQQKLVAGDLRIRGRTAQGLAEKLAHSHG